MKKIIFPIVFFYSLFAFGQTHYSEIYESDSMINKGIALHDQENYSEAINWYDKISKTDQQYIRAQYEKLLTLITSDKKEEARNLFQNLYETKQMDELPELYVLYGVFLSNQKEFEASEEAFLKAEKFIPKASYLNFNKAILYVRKNERQKAVDHLKKTILYNPNHAASQYFLGIMALEDGNVAVGSMALLAYLINYPTGSFAQEAIKHLNKNFSKEFLKVSDIKYVDQDDDFSELDLILRNGLALNSKYKLQCKIDDVITRQTQAVLEYASTHKIKSGYFENYYIPYLSVIFKENLTEGFLYYILLSMEDHLGKKLKNEKKKILKFSDEFVKPRLWDYYGSRFIEINGKTEKVTIWFRDGNPYFVGKNLEKFEGNYLTVNKYFQTLSLLNYKDGKLEGLQKYYYDNGNLKEETYFVNDKKEGESRDYYPNGTLKVIEHYKDDLLEGSYVSYSPTGYKSCEFFYKNNKKEGKGQCFYPDGSVKFDDFYVDGELDQVKKHYSETGFLSASYQLKNGVLDGETVEYFEPNKVKSKATYLNGNVQGSRFFYYGNGNVYTEEVFENDALINSKEYYSHGKLSILTQIDPKKNTTTYTYHNTDGEPYFSEVLKDKAVIKAFQYKKGNPNPSEIEFSKKPYVIHNLEGVKIMEGKLVNGIKQGEWNYYFNSGNLRTKEHYADNALEGIKEVYTQEGNLYSKSNRVNDEMSGLYESFNNGRLEKQFYYKNNEQNGPFKVFYPDGSLSFEGFTVEDESHFKQLSYTQNGRLFNESNFWYGYLIKTQYFDLQGNLDYEINYHELNGKLKNSRNQGLVNYQDEYVFGVRNGLSTTFLKDGTLLSESYFKNGVTHGTSKSFFPNGKLKATAEYFSGKMHGEAQYFDLLGHLRFKTQYVHNEKSGLSYRIYENQKTLYEYEELNDYHHGRFTYFNKSGEVVAQINYDLGIPVSYQVLNENGTLGETIKMEKTTEVVSKYPSGSVACKIPFENHLLHGKLEIFSKNGQLQYASSFSKNDLHGERIEYYDNGKVYKKENLAHNKFEGIQTYFEKDGKLALEVAYQFDEFHGDFKIYKNGVLTKTIQYDSDEIISIP